MNLSLLTECLRESRPFGASFHVLRDRGRAAEVGVREEEGDVVEVRRYGRVGDGEAPMLALTQLSNYLTI